MEAFHDIWVVGDEFIKDSVATIQTLGWLTLQKRPVQQSTGPPPNKMFLFNNFNVLTYYCSLATRGLNRLLYPFVDALNARPHLPQYILIAPDKDMITNLRNFTTTHTMGECLSYIINKMDMHIQRRRQDLANKCLGALSPDTHPLIIWIRMLKRPFIEGDEATRVFSLRNKFNSVIEEQILNSKNNAHRIMSIDVKLDEFDRQGNLTSIGKTTFWREVDCAMKKLDLGDITLLPRKLQPNPKLPPQSIQNTSSRRKPSMEFMRKVAEQFHSNHRSPIARKRLWSPRKHRRSSSRQRSKSRPRSKPKRNSNYNSHRVNDRRSPSRPHHHHRHR